MGPSRGEADCARRSPGDASKDAGSIPATSTPPLGSWRNAGSSWRKAGATANSGGPGFVLSGWSSHAQAALPGPQSSTSPSQVVYAGLSRVTQVWLAGEPRDAV